MVLRIPGKWSVSAGRWFVLFRLFDVWGNPTKYCLVRRRHKFSLEVGRKRWINTVANPDRTHSHPDEAA